MGSAAISQIRNKILFPQNMKLIVTLFLTIGFSKCFGLQCYDCQISLTNLLPACLTSDSELGILKECSADDNSCFKIYGEGTGGQTMFYRGCEKIQDPKDHCEKTTVAQLGSASKCHCLGDGCNSASRLKSYFGIAFSILAIIMFR